VLCIRSEQIEALNADSEKSLLNRLETTVQSILVSVSDRAALRAAIRNLVIRARGEGMSTEYEIAVYVTAAVLLRAGFERDPAIESILSDHESKPANRAARLAYELSRRLSLPNSIGPHVE